MDLYIYDIIKEGYINYPIYKIPYDKYLGFAKSPDFNVDLLNGFSLIDIQKSEILHLGDILQNQNDLVTLYNLLNDN